MNRAPVKIGVTGTHSSGKSTFLTSLAKSLEPHGLRIARVDGIAQRCQELGFPILTEHTYESTLWIISECMRREVEASLSYDVILVDRPAVDALGYLTAALETTRRVVSQTRLEGLKSIARAHSADLDLLVVTSLDPAIPLGEGRDRDMKFRLSVARHIEALSLEIAPDALQMTPSNSGEIVSAANKLVRTKLSLS